MHELIVVKRGCFDRFLKMIIFVSLFKDNVKKKYGVVAKICGCFEFCAVTRSMSNFALKFRNNHKIYVI